jgi:hypothetical protein
MRMPLQGKEFARKRMPRTFVQGFLFTRQEQKDARRLASAGLRPKAEQLLSVLADDPWRRPPKLLRMIALLREQQLPHMVQLGNTLHSWREEIATMWRFTRNNGITEGFHTKMRFCRDRPTAFATSTTTDSGLR